MKKLLIKAISLVLILAFSADIVWCDSDFFRPNQINLAPYSIFKKSLSAESSADFKGSIISNIKALTVFFTIFQIAVVENTEKRLLPKVLRYELQEKDFNDIIDGIDFEKIEADKLHGVIFIPFDGNKEVRIFNSSVPKEMLVVKEGEKVIEEGESTNYIIQIINKGLEKKKSAQPVLASISDNKISDVKQSVRDSKAVLNSVSELMVSIHSDICDKFPRYKFTIRDLKKWVVFVKRYADDFGMAQALIRGCLYMYSDRLLDYKDKELLADRLKAFENQIKILTREPIDITAISDIRKNAVSRQGIVEILTREVLNRCLKAEFIYGINRVLKKNGLREITKADFVDIFVKILSINKSGGLNEEECALALILYKMGHLPISTKELKDYLIKQIETFEDKQSWYDMTYNSDYFREQYMPSSIAIKFVGVMNKEEWLTTEEIEKALASINNLYHGSTPDKDDKFIITSEQAMILLHQAIFDFNDPVIDLGLNIATELENALTQVPQSGSASKLVKINNLDNTILIGDLSLPINQSNEPDDLDIPPLDKVDLVLTNTTVENLQKIAYATNLKDPLLLVGPTATGKSSPIKYLASLTHNKHMAISMNKDISSYELIGGFKPKEGQDKDQATLEWKDGTLVKAMKEGYWLTLEELNLAPTEVLELLNFYLVHGCLKVNIQGKSTEIWPHENFRLFATMNPESYSARSKLSDALMGRFRVKYFGQLPDAELAEIINVRCQIPTEIGIRLVQAHNAVELLAKSKTIGKKEKEPYEFNLRNLLRLTDRIKQDLKDKDISKMPYEELLPLIAHHVNETYLDVIRDDTERKIAFTSMDTLLAFTMNNITYDSLRLKIDNKDKIDIASIQGGAIGKDVLNEEADLVNVPTTLTYLQRITDSLKYKENILLVGPTASAKTSLIRYLSRLSKNKLEYINIHNDTAIEELIGGYVPTKERGVYIWQDGILPKAMEEGSWLFIDEFNMNELPEYFNTVLDDGYLILPNGEKVPAQPSFRLIGAMNPPEYEGRNPLSPALRSRMKEMWVDDYLSEEELVQIVSSQLNISKNTADYYDVVWKEGYKKTLMDLGIEIPPELLNPREILPQHNSASFAMARASFSYKILTEDELLSEIAVQRNLGSTQIDQLKKRIRAFRNIIEGLAKTISPEGKIKFEPGTGWAYIFEKDTITYPIMDLISKSSDYVVGVSLHEGGHRDISRVDIKEDTFKEMFGKESTRLLLNGFEDPRTNNWVVKKLPGSPHYFGVLYDEEFPIDLDKTTSFSGYRKSLVDQEGGKKIILPHMQYILSVIDYWRHMGEYAKGRQSPYVTNDKVKEVFAKTVEYFKDIFETLPENVHASEKEKDEKALLAAKKVQEKILPFYKELVEESVNQLKQMMKDGKVKPGKGEGKDTSGLSPEELDDEARSIIEQKSKELADSLDGKMDSPNKEAIEKYREATAKEKISDEDKEKARKTLEEYRKKIGKLRELMDRGRASERERKEAQTNYERVYEKISHLIEHLKGYLGNIFLKNTKATYKGYHRSGQRLDIRKLIEYEASFKTDDRLWLRRKLPSKKDFKFTLVIDESGSMGGAYGERAIEALLLFMETLDLLEINFEIIGFSDAPSIHRKFNGKMSAPEKEDMIDEVSRYMGNGCTADADALKLGIDNMKEQSGERRVILVLTDGQGNINTTGMAMDDILKEAESKNIEVIGIGIGEGMEYVKKTYPYHVTVPDMDELPLEVAALLEHRILGEKIDRTKPAYFGLQSFGMVKNPNEPTIAIKEKESQNAVAKQEDLMSVIHSLNLNLTPAVPKGKILWHVIPQELIPYSIRSKFIASVNEMNKIPRIREKIKVVTERQDFNDEVARLINNNDNIVDAAVDKKEKLENLPKGVKALVFDGELGDFRQLEGILAALRALQQNNTQALLNLYKMLTGESFSGTEADIMKNIEDPMRLVRFIIFNLKPIEKISGEDLKRLNNNLLRLIESA